MSLRTGAPHPLVTWKRGKPVYGLVVPPDFPLTLLDVGRVESWYLQMALVHDPSVDFMMPILAVEAALMGQGEMRNGDYPIGSRPILG